MADDGGGDALSQRIGQRIVERRQALGMSRAALATNIGISEPSLQIIENGEANTGVSQLIIVARALDMKLIDLIG